MNEKSLETSVSNLFDTLNGAIEQGLDNLPQAATIALADIQTYFLVQTFIGAFWFVLGIPVLCIFAWMFKKAVGIDDTDGQVFFGFLAILGGLGALGGIIFGAIHFSNSLATAIAPLGSILSRHL